MSICQRERWLAMIARSGDEVVLAPLGEAAHADASSRVDLRHPAARLLHRSARGDLRVQRAQHGVRECTQRARWQGPTDSLASALARLGLSPDQVAVLSAAASAGRSAMAVVTVIDHGIQDHFHPDVVLGDRLRTRAHHDQPHDRPRRNPLDERLAHLPRRIATRPRQACSTRRRRRLSPPTDIHVSKREQNAPINDAPRSPNLRLDGTGPASKVLSHGFESGQRTPGVGALFLEPAKCRCAVASRCANGVRPGTASARIADSRLHLCAPRRRVDVRAVLVQTRRAGGTVGDPGRPRHRRDIRPRRRPAPPGGQSDQRAPHRRSGE